MVTKKRSIPVAIMSEMEFAGDIREVSSLRKNVYLKYNIYFIYFEYYINWCERT
jgi:hypothetical protein